MIPIKRTHVLTLSALVAIVLTAVVAVLHWTGPGEASATASSSATGSPADASPTRPAGEGDAAATRPPGSGLTIAPPPSAPEQTGSTAESTAGREQSDSDMAWQSEGETVGAWVELTWPEPTWVSHAVIRGAEDADQAFSGATLTFDGADPLDVRAGESGDADVTFAPRPVSTVRLTVTEVPETTISVGLAEFTVDDSAHGSADPALPDGPDVTSDDIGEQGPVASDDSILFQDDFTGPAGALPDQAMWEDYSVTTYNPSAAFGLLRPGNSETLDGEGHLVIPATPTAGSAIRTGANFGFEYGIVSAWIKLPAEPGYWPAFWTLNSPPDGSERLPVGEIDVMEGYTTWSNVYIASGHTWTGDGATTYHSPENRCPGAEDADLTGRYNKFTARIEPGRITYYFNDVECGRAYVRDPGRAWAFGPDITSPNWLILDLAIGGADGQQIPASRPAQMLVDRVEVLALPGAVTPSSPGDN